MTGCWRCPSRSRRPRSAIACVMVASGPRRSRWGSRRAAKPRAPLLECALQGRQELCRADRAEQKGECCGRRLQSIAGHRPRMLQEILIANRRCIISALLHPRAASPVHRLGADRVPSPKFLSFHCGSAQCLATVSGDSVALAGATGASSEQAPRSASSNTMTPSLIAKSPAAAPICRKLPHYASRQVTAAGNLQSSTAQQRRQRGVTNLWKRRSATELS